MFGARQLRLYPAAIKTLPMIMTPLGWIAFIRYIMTGNAEIINWYMFLRKHWVYVVESGKIFEKILINDERQYQTV